MQNSRKHLPFKCACKSIIGGFCFVFVSFVSFVIEFITIIIIAKSTSIVKTLFQSIFNRVDFIETHRKMCSYGCDFDYMLNYIYSALLPFVFGFSFLFYFWFSNCIIRERKNYNWRSMSSRKNWKLTFKWFFFFFFCAFFKNCLTICIKCK